MQKLYYSIKEVSELIDEEPYILRYWEKEFRQLKPSKNKSGNRTYSPKDIALLFFIKKILREEKKSIKEAKEAVDSAMQNETALSVDFIEDKKSKIVQKSTEKTTQADTVGEKSESRDDVEEFLQNILELIKHL